PDCRHPSGGDGGGDTPVPIPNTAVKPSSADGTAWSPCGRVGRRRILSERPRSANRPGPFVVQASVWARICRAFSEIGLGLEPPGVTCNADDAFEQGLNGPPALGEVGAVPSVEPAQHSRVACGEVPPGPDIARMDVAQILGRRGDSFDAGDVRGDPGGIGRDLASNLGLVDE